MTLSLCEHHSKWHWFYLLIPSTVIVIIWLSLESDMERQDNWWKVRNQNSLLIAEWKDLSQLKVKSIGKVAKLVLKRQSWKDRGTWRGRSRELQSLWSASALPRPAALSSCHPAISHGQLEILLSPRSVLVSAGLPGTHTVRASLA